MNMSSNNTIYGVENEELTLACFSKGGKPIGNISWHNGTKMLASSNENTEWLNFSFILNRYHDGQVLNCSVQHDMLDFPLNIPVKLNVQCKYVSWRIYYKQTCCYKICTMYIIVTEYTTNKHVTTIYVYYCY